MATTNARVLRTRAAHRAAVRPPGVRAVPGRRDRASRCAGGGPRAPLTLDDLPRIPEVFSLALSPDGSRLAFVIETADEPANRTRHRLAAAGPRRRTADPAGRAAHDRPGRCEPGAAALVARTDRTWPTWTTGAARRSSGPGTRRAGSAAPLTTHPVGRRQPGLVARMGRGSWSSRTRRRSSTQPVPIAGGGPAPARAAGHAAIATSVEGRGWLDGRRRAPPPLAGGRRDGRPDASSTDGRRGGGRPGLVAGRPQRSRSWRTAPPDRDRHFGGEAIHHGGRGEPHRAPAHRGGRDVRQPRLVSRRPAHRLPARGVAAPASTGHLERLWVADVASGEEPAGPRRRSARGLPAGRLPHALGAGLDPGRRGRAPDRWRMAAAPTWHASRPDGVERLTDGREVVARSRPRMTAPASPSSARTPDHPGRALAVAGRVGRPGVSGRRGPGASPASARLDPSAVTVDRPDGTAIERWLLLPPDGPDEGRRPSCCWSTAAPTTRSGSGSSPTRSCWRPPGTRCCWSTRGAAAGTARRSGGP